MFTHAIVRKPARLMVNGITSANSGKPIYEKAVEQHVQYVETLQDCGVEVITLEADERFPDSTFVEDTALLTKTCAIIMKPGAPSRQGEETEIREVLKTFYTNIESIEPPGTAEGGDIMMVGDHFYIGLSERTNQEGMQQLLRILDTYGYTGTAVPLTEVLHLKTGLAYLENNTLVVAGEFIDTPIFDKYQKLVIHENESYAANCIWVNGYVIVPAGYDQAKTAIEEAGYETKEVDVSEFRKLDGGLSCLSLRF